MISHWLYVHRRRHLDSYRINWRLLFCSACETWSGSLTRDCLGCKSGALQMFWLTYLLTSNNRRKRLCFFKTSSQFEAFGLRHWLDDQSFRLWWTSTKSDDLCVTLTILNWSASTAAHSRTYSDNNWTLTLKASCPLHCIRTSKNSNFEFCVIRLHLMFISFCMVVNCDSQECLMLIYIIDDTFNLNTDLDSDHPALRSCLLAVYYGYVPQSIHVYFNLLLQSLFIKDSVTFRRS